MVAEQATMKEAIEEMSAKRLGMTTVVDAAGRLVGIITDGDLRRQQLAHGAALLDRRAGECMTAGAQAHRRRRARRQGARVMEAHASRASSITDEAGRPAGVIHLHDILRAKIV